MDFIKSNMDEALKKIELGKEGKGSKLHGFCGRIRDSILSILESLLDGGDAIRRRKKVDQIYRDLAAEKISPAQSRS